jgi:type IV pilus assembly protein PilM
MAFSMHLPRKRIANIIINDHSIRFVELKQANPPIAQKCEERFLPTGIIKEGKINDFDSLSNILDECIDDWKIKHRSVRFIIPDSLVIIRKVTIPADIQDDEIKGYLYMELGSTIHLPFEDPILDIFQLNTSETTKEVLLFAVPEKYVLDFTDLFTNLKLHPIAADISPLALYRLYHHLDLSRKQEILLTVQFDLTAVSLCIFEGTIPVVMRQLPFDFDINKWDIKRDSMGTDIKFKGNTNELALQLEDVFKEINKFFDFYRYTLNNGKKQILKILLNGDHPILNLVLDELIDRYDVPINMLNLETAKNKTDKLPSKYYLCLGLALKEV